MLGRSTLLLTLGVLLLPTVLALPSSQRLLRTPSLNPYPSQPALHFSRGCFKLVVVSDTHVLDDQAVPGNGSNVSRASTEAVRKYLEMEKPDYIVHTGDIVAGEKANSTEDVVGAVHQILGPIVNAKIPFSTSKGNHDNDRYSSHGLITDIEHKLAPTLSYTRKAPAGVGGGEVGTDNYWVPIYENEAIASVGSTPPKLLLWFFDSRSGKQMLSNGGAGIDDWVDSSVGEWIKRETEAMQQAWTTLPPSLLFVHIPLHASLVTQNDLPYSNHVGGVANETSGNFTHSKLAFPGLNDDKPLGSQGGESATVPYDGQDLAFINAFIQSAAGLARVHGIVSGHDHGNDWCAPSNMKTKSGQILPLCFAKHSGFGGYDHSHWNHGVRVFKFHLTTVPSSVQTYIRFLTGEKRYDTDLSDAWASQVPTGQ